MADLSHEELTDLIVARGGSPETPAWLAALPDEAGATFAEGYEDWETCGPVGYIP